MLSNKTKLEVNNGQTNLQHKIELTFLLLYQIQFALGPSPSPSDPLFSPVFAVPLASASLVPAVGAEHPACLYQTLCAGVLSLIAQPARVDKLVELICFSQAQF